MCRAAGERPLPFSQGTVQWKVSASNRASWSVLLSRLVRSNTPLPSPALVTLTFILPPLARSLSLSLSLSPSFLSLLSSSLASPSVSPTSSRSPCVCLPSNSQRLKQPGLLREVNCTQIMFDRKRSEGAMEKRRKDRGQIEGRREGRREGWMSAWEDNCAREGRCD